MNANTPGPWRVGIDPAVVWQENGAETMIAVLKEGADVEREANARLIAAAPDLVSSLRLALNTLGAKGGPSAAERDMAMASARIALRKAGQL